MGNNDRARARKQADRKAKTVRHRDRRLKEQATAFPAIIENADEEARQVAVGLASIQTLHPGPVDCRALQVALGAIPAAREMALLCLHRLGVSHDIVRVIVSLAFDQIDPQPSALAFAESLVDKLTLYSCRDFAITGAVLPRAVDSCYCMAFREATREVFLFIRAPKAELWAVSIETLESRVVLATGLDEFVCSGATALWHGSEQLFILGRNADCVLKFVGDEFIKLQTLPARPDASRTPSVQATIIGNGQKAKGDMLVVYAQTMRSCAIKGNSSTCVQRTLTPQHCCVAMSAISLDSESMVSGWSSLPVPPVHYFNEPPVLSVNRSLGELLLIGGSVQVSFCSCWANSFDIVDGYYALCATEISQWVLRDNPPHPDLIPELVEDIKYPDSEVRFATRFPHFACAFGANRLAVIFQDSSNEVCLVLNGKVIPLKSLRMTEATLCAI